MYIAGSVIAGLVAVGCLIGSVAAYFSQSRKRRGFISGTGTVVGLEKRIFRAGSAGVYCPVVEFMPGAGETIRFESAFGSNPASQKVGDKVKVVYNPQNPKEAEVDSGLSKWLAPGCLLAFSLGACLFSFIFLGISLITRTP